jgi:hypothetical protein
MLSFWINAAGPQTAVGTSTENTWWLYFWLLLGIFAVAMTTVAGVLSRKSVRPSRDTERKNNFAVFSATGATVLILLGLIVISMTAGRSASGSAVRPALTTKVLANR